jgi:hypothetical protein
LSVRPNVTRAGDPTGSTDVSEKLINVKSGLELVLDEALFPLEQAVTTAALAPATRNARRLRGSGI